MDTSTQTVSTTTARSIRRIAGAMLAGTALSLGSITAFAPPASAVSHAQAENAFRSVGITWSSSGNCSNRNNPSCTSFEGLRQATVDGARTLKRSSGCPVNITGGTETGHAGGEKSHGNGWKLDMGLNSCLSNYIQSNFSRTGTRSDGSPIYTSGSGNVYAKEGNHWDVLYNNCGGC